MECAQIMHELKHMTQQLLRDNAYLLLDNLLGYLLGHDEHLLILAPRT